MNQKETIEMLCQQLTTLLGKQRYQHHKQACTGEYRGHYDYSLEFEDGSKIWICMGREDYLDCLRVHIADYSFFRQHEAQMTRQTAAIVERDNRQARILGLPEIQFHGLHLYSSQRSHYCYWIGLKYSLPDRTLRLHLETSFFYAMRGRQVGGMNTDEYFNNKINRPDNELGGYKWWKRSPSSVILLGHLHDEPREVVLQEK